MAKMPNSLESLRMNSRPLLASYALDSERAVERQQEATPEEQQFNFQFKKLKPFNPNSLIRILEKNNKNERDKNNEWERD